LGADFAARGIVLLASYQSMGFRTVKITERRMAAALAPQRARRPVHGRCISREHFLQVDAFAAQERKPQRRVLRVRRDLGHVVARAETELLERKFQRHRARAPEAGPDDSQRHGAPPIIVVEAASSLRVFLHAAHTFARAR
jgi:hypothetical protein